MSEMFAGYKVLSELGRGAFGVVKRAVAPDKREVALKIVHFKNVNPEIYTKMKSRFIREVKAGCSINHKNVVKSFHYGEYEKKFFLVSELINGCSLKQKKEENYSLPKALNIVMQILSGLDAIYQQHMIHRDIKPANVLVTKTGVIKIADLGLVKSSAFEDFQTATGTLLGTPIYMSPEQINGERDIDIRADLYSLGVLLFELLAGVPPYQGSTQVEILWRHCEAPIPDIREYQPQISPEMANFITKLLSKAREHRPNNPQQALDILSGLSTLFDVNPYIKTVDLSNSDEDCVVDEMDGVPTIDLESQQVNKKEICLHVVGNFADALLNKRRLSRAKFTIQTATSTKILFVYTTNHAILGRNSIGFDGQTICLRPLDNIQEARAISGRHFSLIIKQQAVWIMDLQSKGTSMDSHPLPPFIPQILEKQHSLNVANSLQLKLTVSSKNDTLRRLILSKVNSKVDIGQVSEDYKSIVIERTNDCKYHYYAIVPNYLRINIESILPDPKGELELMTWAGHLWLCGIHQNQYVCKPILENDSFTISGCKILTDRIKPEDQKVK
ncbi:serine/threonine protein kinase [Candidatus Uabimicrobium sp. HlEnr_7]|uniref:serine/threonine protein kinase n=1 Tax=Candidatus Uabimicrobium helgolandensis TaxID=3095367 RepID=UPI0035591139